MKSHPANAHLAVPIAMRAQADESQPILPPRQTSRMQARAPARPSSWKSWPVIVIGIAVVAIIVAVILMVWPPSGPTKADAKTLAPPPAPERMDTNPMPSTGNGPSGSLDPWKNNPGAAPDPAPSQPPASPTLPDVDRIDPPNPFSGGAGRGMNPDAVVGLMNAMLERTCDRLVQCGGSSDDMYKTACDMARLTLKSAPPPPSCAAAQRCMSKIDALPCDDLDPTATMGMLQGVSDCIEALRC